MIYLPLVAITDYTRRLLTIIKLPATTTDFILTEQGILYAVFVDELCFQTIPIDKALKAKIKKHADRNTGFRSCRLFERDDEDDKGQPITHLIAELD